MYHRHLQRFLRQPISMTSGPAFIYWEQDHDFHFTQINRLHGRLELGTIGRHWSEGALPLSIEEWEYHRTRLAQRDSFTDFVYARQGSDARPQFFRVSGTPTFDPQGNFTGYRGLATDAGALIEQRRTAWLATQTLRSFDAPILWIEETPGIAPAWRVIWSNVAGCSLFGRALEELQMAQPASLFDDATGGPQAIGKVLSERRSAEVQALALSKYGPPQPLRLRVDASTEMPRMSGLPRRALLIATPAHSEQNSPQPIGEDRGPRSLPPLATSSNPKHIAELESFSFAVSHDLRAPLRLIEGFARILQEDYAAALDRVGNDHVQRILLASARMGQMIDSLMELSRLSAQPLTREPVDLSAIAHSIIEDLRNAEPERQVDVEIQPGLRIWGDRTLLRIVLTNLLSNAWKYTRRSERARITFAWVINNDTGAYCVEDNGAGFDMRFVDRLFNPFQRLHSSSEFTGTGVGLATTKRVVNRHGGQVWADSVVNEGSRFYFTLGERSGNRESRNR